MRYFTARSAMILGGAGSVVLPVLAGISMDQGSPNLGLGLAVSAVAALVVGGLGFLEPVGGGTFQQVDMRAREAARKP